MSGCSDSFTRSFAGYAVNALIQPESAAAIMELRDGSHLTCVMIIGLSGARSHCLRRGCGGGQSAMIAVPQYDR
jgi:hypothetical protein